MFIVNQDRVLPGLFVFSPSEQTFCVLGSLSMKEGAVAMHIPGYRPTERFPGTDLCSKWVRSIWSTSILFSNWSREKKGKVSFSLPLSKTLISEFLADVN